MLGIEIGKTMLITMFVQINYGAKNIKLQYYHLDIIQETIKI
jgi:hypothetical protein